MSLPHAGAVGTVTLLPLTTLPEDAPDEASRPHRDGLRLAGTDQATDLNKSEQRDLQT